eukprot:CAMPEP_0195317544 /NCGR_PEP_ID=MMETSP0708-20121125/4313_1 /TAXON_ID=33640 /ORGANISM="Asterionellopsis glacialis, Strain CCMP134" /LENGTH=107 /DNA_ID=CAMNT_0040383267 /DNA_START=207 /DNA_END=530 /DNA_ORIENTATION=+
MALEVLALDIMMQLLLLKMDGAFDMDVGSLWKAVQVVPRKHAENLSYLTLKQILENVTIYRINFLTFLLTFKVNLKIGMIRLCIQDEKSHSVKSLKNYNCLYQYKNL